jgi:putative transposase
MIAQAQRDAPEMSVRRLCMLLSIGHSWYYEHLTAPTQAERDIALRDAIERIVLEFPGDGYRRVAKALTREGWTVNHSACCG